MRKLTFLINSWQGITNVMKETARVLNCARLIKTAPQHHSECCSHVVLSCTQQDTPPKVCSPSLPVADFSSTWVPFGSCYIYSRGAFKESSAKKMVSFGMSLFSGSSSWQSTCHDFRLKLPFLYFEEIWIYSATLLTNWNKRMFHAVLENTTPPFAKAFQFCLPLISPSNKLKCTPLSGCGFPIQHSTHAEPAGRLVHIFSALYRARVISATIISNIY